MTDFARNSIFGFFIVFLIVSVYSCNFFITIIDYEVIPEIEPEGSLFPPVEPTLLPSGESTIAPTAESTLIPTGEPTTDPTIEPTGEPTVAPTTEPTPDPTIVPTAVPTNEPTGDPTTVPGPYEIIFESGSAYGWFGGDDSNPRNVGYGQGVYIDNTIIITDFSFYYNSRFDYSYNPENIGHEVILRLHIRDAVGTIMINYDTIVPDTFTGGWVTWSNLNWPATTGETLIFTAYVVNGYSNMLSSGAAGDSGAGYTAGQRYSKSGTTDATMDQWTGWGVHPWDSWFRLQGYVQ